MNNSRRMPSAGTVIGLIALVVALAGTASALPGKNSVDKNDIKKNAIKSKAIKNGQVKAADIAADAVDSAAIADGGVGTADLAKAEPTHLIGAAGEPPFSNGGDGDCVWTNAGAINLAPVGFYKDPYSRVHLSGVALQNHGSGGDGDCGDVGSTDDNAVDQVVFNLPPGYRPASTLIVGGGSIAPPTAVIASDAGVEISPGDLPVPPGGVAVSTDPGAFASLEAVSFRVADAATARANARGAPDRVPRGLFKLR